MNFLEIVEGYIRKLFHIARKKNLGFCNVLEITKGLIRKFQICQHIEFAQIHELGLKESNQVKDAKGFKANKI